MVMFFTVNVAFGNFCDNLAGSMGVPILRKWTTQEQILAKSLEPFEINASLLNTPKMLKDFVHKFRLKKQIQDLQDHIEKERNKQQL